MVGSNSEGVVSTVPIIPVHGIENFGVVTLGDGSRNCQALPCAFRTTLNKNIPSSAWSCAIRTDKTHLILIAPRRTLCVIRLTVFCLHFNDGFTVPTLGDIIYCPLIQLVEGCAVLLLGTFVFLNNCSNKGPSIFLKEERLKCNGGVSIIRGEYASTFDC